MRKKVTKEIVTGIISFLGGIGLGIFGVFLISTEVLPLIIFACFLFAISIIMYVIWTKFGEKGFKEFSELEEMDLETERLKRQIEHKKLKEQLDE